MKPGELIDLGYADQKAGKVNPVWYAKTGDAAALLYRIGCRAARQDAFYQHLEEQSARSRRLALLMSLDPTTDDQK